MARYKHYEYMQAKLLPITFSRHILPGPSKTYKRPVFSYFFLKIASNQRILYRKQAI
jgi:hypothetical protein